MRILNRYRLLPALTLPAALVAALLSPVPAGAAPTPPAGPTEGAEHRSVPLEAASTTMSTRTLPGADSSADATAEPGAASGPTSTATLTLEKGVHVLGLRWEGGEPERTEVRVRQPGDAWGTWTALEDAVPTAPTAAAAATASSMDSAATGASGVPVEDGDDVVRATTGDVVIGPAEVQVRLVGDAEAATVETWTTSRTASDVETVNDLPVTTDDLVIGTRADWGANESAPRHSRPIDLVNDTPKLGVTVHHTAGINDYAAADVPGIIRGIFYYHGQTLGWDDIGYATLVDKYGRVWEGRAGGVEENVQLAHAFGMNRDWTGVTVLGNHETAQVWKTELDALSELTAWTLDTHDVTPGTTVKYNNPYEGWTRTLDVVHAHRDVGDTLCPGWQLYGLMDALRSKVLTDAAEASDAVQRIGGEDRYEVAAGLARRAFMEGTRTAYLAAGPDQALADALTVGPVAAQQRAAVLLTRKDTVPDATLSALGALGVREVRIVGGTGSVSTAVEDALRGRGLTVTRVEGDDRYEVAARISADAVTRGLTPRTVYVASGQVMSDALGGSAAAAEQKATMLLTRSTRVPDTTSAQLSALRPSRVVVLGGEGTVEPQVLDELRRLLPAASVERIGGRDRYEVSALAAQDAFGSARSAVVASGKAFADAVAGAQLASRHGSPVVLARPGCRPASVDAAYDELDISLSRLAGGPASLSWAAGHTTC